MDTPDSGNPTPQPSSDPSEEPTVELDSGHLDIPGFKVLSLLGKGGMGVVFLAEDSTLRRRVAIKVLFEELSKNREAHSRFLREARLLAKLEHPNVVRVYDFGTVGGNDYLVMEYVEGESLAERIRRTGPLPVDETLKILGQTIDALDAAWEKGIIHRDLKPANILLGRGSTVRVADFGLAKSLEIEDTTSLSNAGRVLGTPQYMSPEQARGSTDVDFRSDIYSLGIVLYEMLTGSPPFKANTPYAIVEQHLGEGVPSPRDRRPEIGGSVEKITRWMTSRSREGRPASYADLRNTLERECFDNDGTPLSQAPTSSLLARTGRGAGGRRARVLLLAVLGLVIAWAVTIKLIQHRAASDRALAVAEKNAIDEYRLVLAPFYGGTDDAKEEAAVMRQLLFTSVADALGSEKDMKILTPDPPAAPRTEQEAIELGNTVYADTVVWGRVVSLRGETIIEPKVTVIRQRGDYRDEFPGRGDLGVQELRAFPTETSSLDSRASKAQEIADLGVVLAARHLAGHYMNASDADRILTLLEGIETPESLYIQGEATLNQFAAPDQPQEPREAITYFERALALDPEYVPAIHAIAHVYATDSRLESFDFEKAFRNYEKSFEMDPTFSSAKSWNRVRDFHILSSLFWAVGNISRSNAVLSASAASVSDDWSAVRLATQFDWLDRREEAARIARTVVKNDPWQIGLLLDLNLEEEARTVFEHESSDSGSKTSDSIAGLTWSSSRYVRFLCSIGEYGEALDTVDWVESECESVQSNPAERMLDLSLMALGIANEDPDWDADRSEWFVFWQANIAGMRSFVKFFQRDIAGAEAELSTIPDEERLYIYWYISGTEAGALFDHFNGLTDTVVSRLLPVEAERPEWDTYRRWMTFLLYVNLLKSGDSDGAENILENELQRIDRRSEQWNSRVRTASNINYAAVLDLNLSPFELFVAVKGGKISEKEAFEFEPHRLLNGPWNLKPKQRWKLGLAYYFGAAAATEGDSAKARALLEEAVATGLRHAPEWHLADHALTSLPAN